MKVENRLNAINREIWTRVETKPRHSKPQREGPSFVVFSPALTSRKVMSQDVSEVPAMKLNDVLADLCVYVEA